MHFGGKQVAAKSGQDKIKIKYQTTHTGRINWPQITHCAILQLVSPLPKAQNTQLLRSWKMISHELFSLRLGFSVALLLHQKASRKLLGRWSIIVALLIITNCLIHRPVPPPVYQHFQGVGGPVLLRNPSIKPEISKHIAPHNLQKSVRVKVAPGSNRGKVTKLPASARAREHMLPLIVFHAIDIQSLCSSDVVNPTRNSCCCAMR
ncbi:hypothetical protein B0H66DRAFT_319703 [Apodospora peruviana]|uniref:Uncharacterized protein n=1 Tax=Apodospora peruviana TaxID=516989 RepID=A0AAE0M1L2_9PEZI|nr:hypothetical protein B0H66DRAFT_319703 [Apodospora peruviana]